MGRPRPPRPRHSAANPDCADPRRLRAGLRPDDPPHGSRQPSPAPSGRRTPMGLWSDLPRALVGHHPPEPGSQLGGEVPPSLPPRPQGSPLPHPHPDRRGSLPVLVGGRGLRGVVVALGTCEHAGVVGNGRRQDLAGRKGVAMHGQVVHAVTAHVLAGGCDNCDAITWMTWLLNSIWGTMSLGVKVGAGAFLLIVLLVRRTLKAVVLALLVCGIAFWGVIGGGIGTAGDMV